MYVHASNLINTLIYKSIDYQKATTAAAAPARHIYMSLSIKTYSKNINMHMVRFQKLLIFPGSVTHLTVAPANTVISVKKKI